MRLAMVLPPREVGGGSLRERTLAEGAARIEQAGFHGVWAFDAVSRGLGLPDPLTALAAAATATRNVELGTGILQICLRNPVELANRVMTIHLVCGDRLSLGVGPGSTKDDFDACGATYEDRFDRFGPSLEVMRSLWRGETVGTANLTPWEATLGGPPILIGTWSARKWLALAGTDFDGWIASAEKGGRLKEGITEFRAAGGTRAVVTNIHVDLRGGDAPPAAGEPFSLRCSPRQAKTRLRWLADLGYDDVVLRTADHTEANLEAIRRLAPDV